MPNMVALCSYREALHTSCEAVKGIARSPRKKENPCACRSEDHLRDPELSHRRHRAIRRKAGETSAQTRRESDDCLRQDEKDVSHRGKCENKIS